MERRRQLDPKCFRRPDVEAARDSQQSVTTKLIASRISGFGNAVTIRDYEISDHRFDDLAVVSDIRQETERHAGRPRALH